MARKASYWWALALVTPVGRVGSMVSGLTTLLILHHGLETPYSLRMTNTFMVEKFQTSKRKWYKLVLQMGSDSVISSGFCSALAPHNSSCCLPFLKTTSAFPMRHVLAVQIACKHDGHPFLYAWRMHTKCLSFGAHFFGFQRLQPNLI